MNNQNNNEITTTTEIATPLKVNKFKYEDAKEFLEKFKDIRKLKDLLPKKDQDIINNNEYLGQLTETQHLYNQFEIKTNNSVPFICFDIWLTNNGPRYLIEAPITKEGINTEKRNIYVNQANKEVYNDSDYEESDKNKIPLVKNFDINETQNLAENKIPVSGFKEIKSKYFSPGSNDIFYVEDKNKYLYIDNRDKLVYWDMNGKQIPESIISSDYIVSFFAHKNGNICAVSDKYIYQGDLGAPLQKTPLPENFKIAKYHPRSKVLFSPDGKHSVVSGSVNGNFGLLIDGQKSNGLPLPVDKVSSWKFLDNNNLIVENKESHGRDGADLYFCEINEGVNENFYQEVREFQTKLLDTAQAVEQGNLVNKSELDKTTKNLEEEKRKNEQLENYNKELKKSIEELKNRNDSQYLKVKDLTEKISKLEKLLLEISEKEEIGGTFSKKQTVNTIPDDVLNSLKELIKKS